MKTDELTAFAGKGEYTAQDCNQTLAINAHIIGVLGDNAIIIWIATFKQSANELPILELYLCTPVIEFNGYITIAFREYTLD